MISGRKAFDENSSLCCTARGRDTSPKREFSVAKYSASNIR
jgi:hypothetical protein